jgi:predicted GNAT superfamily acetyltransferase
MTDAWDLAREAAGAAGVDLRPCESADAQASLLRVNAATWGASEVFPPEVVRAMAYSGNVPFGAFDGDELIGYVLGWVGPDPVDGLHVHSHMLAALPGRRHRGVGYALKLAQRAQALDAGIDLVRWTFDPLVSRNAWFNLVKLGAIADRFEPNFYGTMTDEINRGERSDRLVVRWDLHAMRPGMRPHVGVEVLSRLGDEDMPRPSSPQAPAGDIALIEIPREYHDLRAADPLLGQDWREATGAALQACWDAGSVVTGFTKDGAYVLEKGRPA